MAKRYFDEERDYLAIFIPDFFDDPETHSIRDKYKSLWNVLCGSAIREVFGTMTVPKTATEEQILEVKRILRVKIDTKFHKSPKIVYGEETEPAE